MDTGRIVQQSGVVLQEKGRNTGRNAIREDGNKEMGRPMSYFSDWCENLWGSSAIFMICLFLCIVLLFSVGLVKKLNRANEAGFWLTLATILLFIYIILHYLWATKPDINDGDKMMITEKETFTVTWYGTPEVIKSFDFTDSFEGLRAAITGAYTLLTNKPETEVTVTITEKPAPVGGERSFTVYTVVESDTKNKKSLCEILYILGFMGKRKRWWEFWLN
jgi:hypothetical protein